MANVRVRALERGYDGHAGVRRYPGEEFTYNIERQGQGKWFEVINEPVQEAHDDRKVTKKRATKKKVTRKTRDDDDVNDLLA